jgi:predicted RNA-binding Zn ribbon-like protein
MTQWRSEDLVGGDVVLDFANTVGDTDKNRRMERLLSWSDAVSWARFVKLLTPAEAAALRTVSREQQALSSLRSFREAIYAALSARAAGSKPEEQALRSIETMIRRALATSRLSIKGGLSVWQPVSRGIDRDLIHHRLALRLLHLLSGSDLSRLRECARCTWLLLNHGRGRGRSWCRMETCGNRAKAERYRRRELPLT